MTRIRRDVQDGSMRNEWNRSERHAEEMAKLQDIRRNLDGRWNRTSAQYRQNYERIEWKRPENIAEGVL